MGDAPSATQSGSSAQPLAGRPPPTLYGSNDKYEQEPIDEISIEDVTNIEASRPVLSQGTSIYSQAAMSHRETGARPKVAAMQSRLTGASLPPPMNNVRISKYYEHQGYPASQIKEPTRIGEFRLQAQSSPPPLYSPRPSNSQHENLDMPSSVCDVQSAERDHENQRDDDRYRQAAASKLKFNAS